MYNLNIIFINVNFFDILLGLNFAVLTPAIIQGHLFV